MSEELERYIPLTDLPTDMIPKISQMIPAQAKIRVKELLLSVQSTNDNKGTVTFIIEGVFPPKLPVMEDEPSSN